MSQDIAYAGYGCDAQSQEARNCPGKDAFVPRAQNSGYQTLNQILLSRTGGFVAPTNIDAAGADNAGLIQQNYLQNNPNLAGQFLTANSQVVDDFTTCNCGNGCAGEGDYVKMDDGCGCDCHPYGWDWNHPTGNNCAYGGMGKMLLFLFIAIVIFYLLCRK